MEWDDNQDAPGYMITIRTYGTWLHGDDRHSVDTHDYKNIYGTPDRKPNDKLLQRMRANMTEAPFALDLEQRRTVKKAIEGVCAHRRYQLLALNVRTNHVHIVVSASKRAEKRAIGYVLYHQGDTTGNIDIT